MTKVWLRLMLSLVTILAPVGTLADGVKESLRLIGFVAPRAFVSIEAISRDLDFVDLHLQKNTMGLNFTMIVAAEDNEESWIKRPTNSLSYVFSALGQSRRVNLKKIRKQSGHIHMTVVSP